MCKDIRHMCLCVRRQLSKAHPKKKDEKSIFEGESTFSQSQSHSEFPFLSFADPVAGANSQQRVGRKSESPERSVQPASDVVTENYSTPHSLLGSVVLWVMMLAAVVLVLHAFVGAYSPSINEVSAESGDFEHDLPDIALTINIADLTEREVLRHFKPTFTWHSIKNGFTDKKSSSWDTSEAWGENCELRAGYRGSPTENNADQSNARWPVFCLLNNGSMKLRGRFGDPEWKFLYIILHTCNDETDNCATLNDTKKMFGGGVPLEIWLKSKSSDWKVSNTLLKNPGQVQVARQNELGWSYFVFEMLPYGTAYHGSIQLQLNEAHVRSKWHPFYPEVVHKWFTFHDYKLAPSSYHYNTDMWTHTPAVTISLRVAPLMRQISVDYFGMFQTMGEIGGNHTIALYTGVAICILAKRICPRMRRTIMASLPSLRTSSTDALDKELAKVCSVSA